MAPIDLEDAAKQYLTQIGKDFKALNFGRLKLKIDDIEWLRSEQDLAQNSNTRVVEMSNDSREDGEGHLNIEKEGKPVFTFTLTKGLTKGLTNRVKFPGPPDVLNHFRALVDRKRSEVKDYTGLALVTSVNLPRGTTTRAGVSNTTKVYRGKFECTASFSGLIGAPTHQDVPQEFEVEDLIRAEYLPRHVQLEGEIHVHFQDKHIIRIQ